MIDARQILNLKHRDFQLWKNIRLTHNTLILLQNFTWNE